MTPNLQCGIVVPHWLSDSLLLCRITHLGNVGLAALAAPKTSCGYVHGSSLIAAQPPHSQALGKILLFVPFIVLSGIHCIALRLARYILVQLKDTNNIWGSAWPQTPTLHYGHGKRTLHRIHWRGIRGARAGSAALGRRSCGGKVRRSGGAIVWLDLVR